MTANLKFDFLFSLFTDIKVIWRCKLLVLKPLLFTLGLIQSTVWLKYYCPIIFMDDLGDKAEIFVGMVFGFIAVLHGILIAMAIGMIGGQNEKIELAIGTEDFELFKSYFFQRIQPMMKLLIFFLSILMVYCVANCDFNSPKNNMIAQGIMMFVITLAWVVAYELDDPYSAIRNLRERVPKKWWDAVKENNHEKALAAS